MESAPFIPPHPYSLAPPKDPKATRNEYGVADNLLGVAALSGEGSMAQPVPSSSKREGQQSTNPAMVIFGKQAHPDDVRWQSLAGRIVLYNRASQIWVLFCFLYFYCIFKISKFSKLFFLGEGILSQHTCRGQRTVGRSPFFLSFLSCEFCGSHSDQQA